MKYWLAVDGESTGPHSVEEIREMLRQHRVTRETPAMPEDGEEWGTVRGIPEIAPPPAPPIQALQRHSALGGTRTAAVQPTAAAATRPVVVSQPSSVGPVVIILVVIAVLAIGGGIFVYSHSQKRKEAIAEAEAQAEEYRQAVVAAAAEKATREANPALALEGASREEVIAALVEAGAKVSQNPFKVDFSSTPTSDVEIAMLKSLTDLEVLYLGSGEITDAGLKVLGGFGELRELSIGVITGGDDEDAGGVRPRAGTPLEVTDAGLEELKDLKGLRKLYLTNCRISDEGFEILDEMRGLSELELIGTGVTEAAARRFAEDRPEVAVTVRSPGFVVEP
ncbi:GYF domain-containing protein [Haloferula sp. A504]|uniref:GYF domain-containing protein n=1 Tax=Haloferula sp. A504 TaxID=3373601 RepID=UPI0031C438E2|nr:GYF domain-containing protein [Verrucomicrobiaceae bacterium E54]